VDGFFRACVCVRGEGKRWDAMGHEGFPDGGFEMV
jgi:hypothetical protein